VRQTAERVLDGAGIDLANAAHLPLAQREIIDPKGRGSVGGSKGKLEGCRWVEDQARGGEGGTDGKRRHRPIFQRLQEQPGRGPRPARRRAAGTGRGEKATHRGGEEGHRASPVREQSAVQWG